MLDAFNITMNRYGKNNYVANFSVAVDNLSPHKRVFIHRMHTDGAWHDIPMYYDSPAGNGKEIWKLRGGYKAGWSGVFSVKMEVDGAQFWDNNDGNNYHMFGSGYTIGNERDVVVSYMGVTDAFELDKSRLFSTIILRNISVSKHVEIVYSFDSWVTSSAVNASYDGSSVLYGYGVYPNPSANNAESWSASFDFPKGKSGEFFVRYNVNGVDYIDNNFGANYRVNPPTANGSMFLRSEPGWGGRPMTAIDNNLWAVNYRVSDLSGREVKFDTFNDWSLNFGDDNADGVTNFNGINIIAPEPGNYRVFFNDLTLEYSFQAYGFNE